MRRTERELFALVSHSLHADASEGRLGGRQWAEGVGRARGQLALERSPVLEAGQGGERHVVALRTQHSRWSEWQLRANASRVVLLGDAC